MAGKRLCKLVERILANTQKVRFAEIDRLLTEFGFERKQPGKGSSHYVYRKKGCNPLTVPKNRPYVKEIYIRQVIKLLDLEVFYEEEC